MEEYKPIIDNWEEFKKACGKPAVSAVRKNRVKAGEDFEQRLKYRFQGVEKSCWNPEIYRLENEKKPGKSLMHWLGEYYVQEESAAVPVEVLQPEKGERVLDMCAAPGGKTTQIASKLNNEGSIIANDSSAQRLKSLHANIYRTGSASVSVTNYDGRNMPEDRKYDRILVDAPCSGEGDRARRSFKPAAEEEKNSLSELQKQLAIKAARMLKSGGKMVYSTCTISPKENEEVVKHLVENTELELEKIKPEFNHCRGLVGFKEITFGEKLSKTVRVYPHHLKSGVIYAAKFRK